MENIERMEPPKSRVKYLEIAEWLEAHPGEWAKVTERDTPELASVWVQKIKTGRLAAFRPPGKFDAYQRGAIVVASYVPEATPAPEE